jgi:hypothetical protein
MPTIKAAGGLLMILAGLALIGVIGAAFLFGMSWITVHVYPWMAKAAGWVLAIDLFFLLPLAIFRTTRPAAAAGLIISAWVYGITNWMLGFLTAFHFWGALGVFIGLCIAGIGVIPIAVLAALINGAWGVLGNLAIGIVLWIVALGLGSFLETRSGPKNVYAGL